MGCSTRPRRCSPERVRPAPTCSPGRVVGWCVPPCHTRALALGYEAGTRVIVLRRARLCARKGRQRVAPSTVLCCLRWEVSSRTAEGGVGGWGRVGWCPPFPHIHVMSCHGALEPSSAGPPSGRPSAERLAVTHTRTPMEWAQVRGGREHHAWREGERCPDQARSTTGMRADAQRHQSRRQAPAFWELVGLTLDGRRAHSSHTW